MPAMPYKISVLVFLKDEDGRLLLIKRNKAPNLGCWSPIGGKLEMQTGESPFECAIRETFEETAHKLEEKDLHLFSMVAEKSYEGDTHWLMFLFDSKKPIAKLPQDIDEGRFGFFKRAEIDALAIPATDRAMLWKCYDEFKNGFTVLRADCHPDGGLAFTVEERI